jgi:hypothetical protein
LTAVGAACAPPHTPQAIEWVRSTYLYVRLQRSPAAYGVPPQPSLAALDRWLRDRLILATVQELACNGMVRGRAASLEKPAMQPGLLQPRFPCQPLAHSLHNNSRTKPASHLCLPGVHLSVFCP